MTYPTGERARFVDLSSGRNRQDCHVKPWNRPIASWTDRGCAIELAPCIGGYEIGVSEPSREERTGA